MASRDVARYLQEVHRHFTNRSQDAPERALQMIRNLKSILEGQFTTMERNLITTMLFEVSESGTDLMTEFIDSLIEKRFATCRADIVKLVLDYIDHIDHNIEAHAPRIQFTMMQCVNNDQSDKTKCYALDCLHKLYGMQLSLHPMPGTDDEDDVDMNARTTSALDIDNVISTLYNNLNLGPSKLRATVRGGILHLLGILRNQYPSKFSPNQLTKLSKELMKPIKVDLSNNAAVTGRNALISGCLSGLQYFLNEDNNNIVREDILNIFKMILIEARDVIAGTQPRYKVVLSSLRLLSDHSFKFDTFIMRSLSLTATKFKKQYKQNKQNDVLQLVLDLSLGNNANVSLEAMLCIQSILKCVTANLLASQSDDTNRKVFRMLFHTFSSLLSQSIQNENSTNHKQIALSIRAFGQLSSTINAYAPDGQLVKVLHSLVSVSKKCISSASNHADGSKMKHFAAFLSAFASIINDIDMVHHEVMDQLSLMIDMIYVQYPATYRKMRRTLYESMTQLLTVLYLKGGMFNKWLQSIVYKGLTYSITTLDENCLATKIADSSTQSGIRVRRCYEEYYTLWKGLLIHDTAKDDDTNHLQEVRSLLFSSLMRNLIEILKQFNLSFQLSDDGVLEHAVLDNANDMELFLNYVEFVQQFVGKICRMHSHTYGVQLETSWSVIFIQTVIQIADTHPMISGLYKILKTLFALHYRQNRPAMEESKEDEEDEQDILMMDEDFDSYHQSLITHFIEKCITKLQTYRDELLYSLIELLLNIPKSLIPIECFIATLLRALSIGKNHIIAGELAITVLEKWCDEYFDDIKDYLNVIVPNLEPYLWIAKETVAGITASANHNNEEEEDDEDRGEEQRMRNKPAKDALQENAETVIYERKKQLIHRILILLGKLGGEYNQAILLPKIGKMSTFLQAKQISDAEAAGKGLFIDTDIIAWDKHERVRYIWGFPDTKLTVYLDGLLPRICELCILSTNRRVKVAASEALHGIIVKMVADNATDPNINRRNPKKHSKQDFEKIYGKIFPVVLKLAVSSETVCKQLFHPLVLQLIHWFTQNIKKDNDETIALLDAITDGLGNENHSSLRDFCGECMAEFVKWSLKNTGSVVASLNIQSLLRRLYALLRHSSPYRRLGACLTFHYIYRFVREDPTVVSRFTLDILTNLIESLGVAHYDTSGIDTIDETRRCINNFEKIIVDPKHGYWKILNKMDKHRQGSEHCKDLSCFIEWCFENLGRIEMHCRRQCMLLIQALAPYSRPINNLSKKVADTVQNWFGFVIKRRKLQYIVSVFEGGSSFDEDNDQSILEQFTSMATRPVHKSIKWLENLSCALDNYYWMIHCKIIENNNEKMIEKLFTQTHFKSYLIDSCLEFLSTCKSLDLSKQMNKLRCDTIIRFYRFIEIMLRNALLNVVERFKYERFYQLLFESLVVPDVVGFMEDDPLRIKQLQTQFKYVISAICEHSGDDKYKLFIVKICRKYFAGKFSPYSKPNVDKVLSIKPADWNTLSFFKLPGKALCFLAGIQLLSKTHNLLQSALDKECVPIAINMADDVFCLCDKPQNPIDQNICAAMLSISLRLGLPSTHLIEYLSDQSKIPLAIGNNDDDDDGDGDVDDEEDILAMDDTNQVTQNGSKGLVFYERFAAVLDSYFLSHFDEFSNIILLRISDANVDESEKRQLTLICTIVLKHITDVVKDSTVAFLSNLMGEFARNHILDNTEETMRLRLSIISVYLMQCKNMKRSIVQYIETQYSNALTNPKQPGAQLQAIRMLPLFISDGNTVPDWLLKAIGKMICNSFPNVSREAYNRGQSEWKSYVQKLQSILDTIIVSESFALLKVVVQLLREKEHKDKAQIDAKLDHLIAKLTTPLNQPKCLEFLSLATHCFLDESFDTNGINNARRWMVESLCVPILETCAISCADKYFQQFTKTLFDIICKYPKGPDQTKHQDTVRLQLLELECSYKLLSLQYRRLHWKSVAKIGEYHRQLIKKYAHPHVTKCGVQGKQESESQMAFHCAAFECLAACLMCTQRNKESDIPKEKLWNMVFMERQGEVLWLNIIDINIDLLFSIETNFGWSLRKLKRKQHMALEGDAFLSPSQSLLSHSSLKSDSYSLSYASQPHHNDDVEDKAMEVDEEEDTEEKEIVLELDALNAMPVMNSMLSVMDGLHKYFGAEWRNTLSLPTFMKLLLQKLQETDRVSSHPTIRFYIAKLIINRPKIFEPFCSYFFKPLVDLCLFNDAKNWGFHYFLRDICELFLFEWRSFVPDMTDLAMNDSACCFVQHLMNMVMDVGLGALQKYKIKQNIHFIQLLLRKWNGIQKVDKRYLHVLLQTDLKKKRMNELKVGDQINMKMQNKNRTISKMIPVQVVKRNATANMISYRVQLPDNTMMDNVALNQLGAIDPRLARQAALWILDALIEADYPAFDMNRDTDQMGIAAFFDSFCSNLSCYSSPVWKLAAKVYGNILRKEDENKDTFEPSFGLGDCVERVKKIISKTIDSDLSKGIKLMHLIGNEWPEFLDYKLMQKILGSLGHIPITCLTDAVSLFAKYVSVPNPDPEVAIWLRPGLQRIFNHNQSESHLAVCDVFLRLIPVINMEIKQELLLQFITHFDQHTNSKVRRKLFGICSYIYDNEPDMDADLKKQVKDVLLSGLADSNHVNRKLLFEFWSAGTRLNSNVVDRLDDLMNKLFTTKTEHLWLHYACFLLLEPMRQSPDFKQLISHRPLAECRFEPIHIESEYNSYNAHSMSQNFAMTPMFTGSLPSTQVQSFVSTQAMQPQPLGYVRATQQRIWTQTQQMTEPKLPSPLDKPTKTRYGSAKHETFVWSKPDDVDNADLFAGSYAELDTNKPKRIEILKQPAMSQRFSASQNNSAVSARISSHDRNKRYKKAWDLRKKESAANSVSLYRKYRNGELPDICIPNSDLMLPLQALHTDPVIAKQLFVLFFDAIYKEAIDRSDRQNNYKQMIETSLVHMLLKCHNDSTVTCALLLCSTCLNDIRIEPKYIADLAIRSNNLYSGVVLLEAMLTKGESIEEPKNQPKRRRLNHNDALSFEEKIYSQLSRLFNLLNEQDTVLALSTNFAKMQATKDGVEFYMKGDYLNAYNAYLGAQNIAKQQKDRCPASVLEKTLWHEESTKCLHKMAKWDMIYDATRDKITNIDSNSSFSDNLWCFLLHKEEYELTQQSALESLFEDWLLSAVKKESVWNTELYPLLKDCIIRRDLDNDTNTLKRDFIESNYSPTLAYIFAIKNDLIRSKLYVHESYEMILEKWTGLPKFAMNAKKVLLSQLQSLVEISEFVRIIEMEKKHKHDSEDIVTFWKRRYPKVTDDVLIWDNLIHERNAYITAIQGTDYLQRMVSECQIDTMYAAVDAMIYQKNYCVADEYMQRALLLGSFNAKFKIQRIRSRFNSILDQNKKSTKEKLQSLSALNEKLTNYISDAQMDEFAYDMCLVKAKMLFQMASFVDDDGALLRYVADANTPGDIYAQSRLFYQKTLGTPLGKQSKEKHSKALIELALFCNERLLSIEERERHDYEKKEKNKIKLFTMKRQHCSAQELELAKEFIESIMSAMMYDSEEGRNLFPRALEITEMNVKNLGPLILKLSEQVPVWMFIRWIAQMLAELGSNSSLREFVFPILSQMARVYPGALIYPFELTSEDLQEDGASAKYIGELRHLIQSMHPGYHLAATLTEALDCMCHPDLKFNDYKKEIASIANDKRVHKREKMRRIETCVAALMDDLFSKSKPYVKKRVGFENERFSRLFGKYMVKFGKNGEKVKRMEAANVVKILTNICKLKDFETFKKKGGKVALKEYSEWLSSFDCSKYDEDLYVPGQFTGSSKPNMAQHLKIVSFDSITLIMGSLRKPKRIKLRTDDEREQMWLVKAGEDLRMDERIEEMFKMINNILCSNALCIERELVLRTYDVIPLNRSTGIIEWIENTIPIKSLISESMKAQQIKQSIDEIIRNDYVNPFTKITRKAHGGAMYCEGILKYKTLHKRLLASFKKAQKRLPETTLQLSLIHMSRNKESYVQLRSRFCKTLSVYTITGYILGIGDRHLDNYLVDESTGQVIGIDFGAAFGYGLGLPVPELMPCRLTRQFVHIMHPLNTKCMIRNYMIYAMSAIVQKKDNLLNIMNVFIKEPSLDWIELAQRNFKKSNAKVLIDEFEDLSLSVATPNQKKKELMWYPKHKIYIAKLKLNCYKSTYVMLEEINSTRHFSSPYRPAMEQIINGFAGDTARKKFTKNKCDSVEDQIDVLIDHADDPHILSLTWQGWCSWI
eukprot:21942_1